MTSTIDLTGIPILTRGAPETLIQEPFRGITAGGSLIPGLFPVQKTGISTEPILDAAQRFLECLNPHQRRKVLHPIDTEEWRWWNNTAMNEHRSGLSLLEMAEWQVEIAWGLIRASLSDTGFETVENITRLNETVGEMTGRHYHFSDHHYWISIMGAPAADEPWGWQFEGHHCIVNFFVLGDQVVMSPAFVGSEPLVALDGKYKGTRVFDRELAAGLDLIQSLDERQQTKAIFSSQLPREILAGAYRDNYEMSYLGIRHEDLSRDQQALLLRLIETYTGYIRPGHAELRLNQVKQHLGDTYFAWAGGTEAADIFYFRVHSPVIIIELDHMPIVAFQQDRSIVTDTPKRDDYQFYMPPGAKEYRGDSPYKQHIHSVVRTPNGNDYGRDYLRQHYERFHPAPTNGR